MNQIKFHDVILFNLYQSCNEDINKYYYIYIITDKDKALEKEEKLKNYLDSTKFNLNIAILQIEQSEICGKDFSVVIDKEFLAKNILDEIAELKTEIKILNLREEKIENRLNGIEETQKNTENRLNGIEDRLNGIENEFSDLKSKIDIVAKENKQELAEFRNSIIKEIKGISEEFRNNNNSEGILASIKRFFGY